MWHLIGFPFKSDVEKGIAAAEMIPIHMNDSKGSCLEFRRQVPLNVAFPRLIIKLVSDLDLDKTIEAEIAYLKGS